MKSDYKVRISKPCNEDWNKMTPNEKGRFCAVCNTTVIDFTNKLPSEIQQFYIQNENQKICGRFRKSQTELVDIRIPSNILFSQNQYHKIFLLALFIAMGTSLFSCSDSNGNKHKIDSITIDKEEKTKRERELNQLVRQLRNNNHRGTTMGPPPPLKYETKPSPKKKIKNESLTINIDTTQTDSKKNETNSVKIGNEPVTMGLMPINVNYRLEEELLISKDSIIKVIENRMINIPAKELKGEQILTTPNTQLKLEKQ
ncbi:hypothetical protein OD917_14435 [Flavobacterium sp. SH_e]|uniref:hypothetical protein n=1 Tax=Flavobacterium TaxID=237 RepID=UPI0021E4725B|nr:hypothetical protein [Flavobacterium sp. SH_e]MCV2486130.1 hypothetical protein [Flavobacterium sp. SH_e]